MSEKNTCMKLLDDILAENANQRTGGKIASDSTLAGYKYVLTKCFNQLHELGYRLQDPRNLGTKHIQALCRKWHAAGILPSTMKSELSRLRRLCRWIGKEGMMMSLEAYLPDVDREKLHVSRAAKKRKSWTECGINVAQKIQEADDLDFRFGLMLRMCLAFDLLPIEVVQLHPWKSDRGDKLVLYKTKNGRRPRDVCIDTEEQRMVLDYVKERMRRKTGFLGWDITAKGEISSLKYSVGRYNRCMAKIGITRKEAAITGTDLHAENATLTEKTSPPPSKGSD